MNVFKCGVILFFLAMFVQCGKETPKKEAIQEITTYDQVSAIIDNGGDTLLAFDMFADWCGPCRMLTPMLDSIAIENKSKVRFFRVNVDKVPQMAQALQIQGIPLVAFFKNKNRVGSVLGLQPRGEYEKMISENGVK